MTQIFQGQQRQGYTAIGGFSEKTWVQTYTPGNQSEVILNREVGDTQLTALRIQMARTGRINWKVGIRQWRWSALISRLGKEPGDQGQERRHTGDFLAEPKAWKAILMSEGYTWVQTEK